MRQKINKETLELNPPLDQIGSTDIYRIFHPTATEYTFLSSPHGIFSRIDCMTGHKTRLRKFKKIEVIPTIFSDHNSMKLDIKNKRKDGKIYKYMEIKQHNIEQRMSQRRIQTEKF